MSMLGLRDLVLIAPTPSLHQGQPISENHTPNLPLPSSAALSVGFGIFPLLTATPCVTTHPQQNNEVQDCGGGAATTNYWNLKMCPQVNPTKKGVINVDDNDKGLMDTEENGVYGPDFRVCQDCGNRAKKDCVFRRCRTCCKGRGYDCSTHVKSTWVPSLRRRERDMTVAVATGTAKRPRALVGSSQNATATSHSSNSNATTTPKSLATSSSHQGALSFSFSTPPMMSFDPYASFKHSLPGHVRAPAVFKCHRVSAIGNGEDEFAYSATVHISGHVFKGFLYDHGVDGKITNAVPCVSELQLGNNCNGKNRECSSAIGLPTNNAYPASAT
ncbi:Protein LATERAL ROOT PRIMORDIUM 1, partial [Mucuna pruriens]